MVSTRNQALCALVFLDNNLLNIDPGNFPEIRWSKKPKKLPVVFAFQEAKAILSRLKETNRLMAMLLYRAGLRK